MTYREKVFSALDAQPELVGHGAARILSERFGCAVSTVCRYMSIWRKAQRAEIVLGPAVPFGCERCEVVGMCRVCLRNGWAPPCEKITEDDQQFYQRQGVWTDVVRTRWRQEGNDETL